MQSETELTNRGIHGTRLAVWRDQEGSLAICPLVAFTFID
jgi:hypothetical protein